MKRLILLVAALAALFPVRAQLTLDACRRLAREHYPAIRQYDLIRRTAAYDISNARRACLPALTLGAQATWQTDAPNFPDALTGMLAQQGVTIPGMHRDQYRLQLELSQTLWDGGKSAADRLLAEAEAAEQSRATDVDLYALEGRVTELYFGILLLDERLAQADLTIGLLRSNLDKVRALQRGGVAMQSDADAVEAELLAAGQQRGQIEAARDSYRRMLALFIGRELGDEVLERPDAAEPAAVEPVRPELAWFDARAELLTARERQVKVATRPRFGLFAQGYYGYPGLDYMQGMMTGDWSWNALIGVRMSWNIGGYYTRRNTLGKLRTARRQIEVQRDIFLFNNRLESTEESGEIARLRRALVDDDRIVQLRRAVREAAESKLRNGVIDTNDLLRTITGEDAAAAARAAREIELLKAIYELKHTMNR